MSIVAAKPKCLGELIQHYRQSKKMTLAKLQEAVGIDKGSLSRIENSEVKRPDFQSILSIAAVLDIPHNDVVEKYIEIGHKSEVVYTILRNELTTLEYPSLIPKIAAKFLQAPNEDSLYLVGTLYRETDSIDNDSIKLSLYDLILDYSRSHGIMPYIAKSMYQRYLIERNDFSRLKETYYSGKYILHYIDFLPQDEQLELHYKLGVHAYNLRFYSESIGHCKKVLAEDGGQSPYKIYALGVLRDAHFGIGEYKEAEMYSIQYKQFNYPHTQEQVVLMEALFNAKKGNTAQAIEQLWSFLDTCSDIFVLSATRHLIQLYLEQNNTEGVKAVLENSKISSSILDTTNPLSYSEYAEYLRLQGEYYLAIGDTDSGISHLMEGALYYSKVNDIIKEKECLNTIVRNHIEQNIPMHKPTLEKLSTYFINSAKEMEDLA
ncbi:helix-turn-helix transcriptional regulator [Paenibacillus thiaminolyticus]|uniref:helix-turn-helix domain-containing protein n=1 Tax=Paenibacillus thiaminolyticus TaxID=49283 RepID=UPI002350ED59|nr:helix-turn-helix transcriptional regulator [Paenibacillus thiaminolyticus]WCR28437.1 helix-turn-helix transcriptional regulator [Paenibacillus thiaminolyticus]